MSSAVVTESPQDPDNFKDAPNLPVESPDDEDPGFMDRAARILEKLRTARELVDSAETNVDSALQIAIKDEASMAVFRKATEELISKNEVWKRILQPRLDKIPTEGDQMAIRKKKRLTENRRNKLAEKRKEKKKEKREATAVVSPTSATTVSSPVEKA